MLHSHSRQRILQTTLADSIPDKAPTLPRDKFTSAPICTHLRETIVPRMPPIFAETYVFNVQG